MDFTSSLESTFFVQLTKLGERSTSSRSQSQLAVTGTDTPLINTEADMKRQNTRDGLIGRERDRRKCIGSGPKGRSIRER